MKVKDFLTKLAGADPEAEVVVQCRGEYSPLAEVDLNCVYVPNSTWSGEIYDTTQSASDACMDPDEWEEFKKRPRCVTLFPTH